MSRFKLDQPRCCWPILLPLSYVDSTVGSLVVEELRSPLKLALEAVRFQHNFIVGRDLCFLMLLSRVGHH
eukprot:2164886-Pleurochrysis_carterae.AAC.3